MSSHADIVGFTRRRKTIAFYRKFKDFVPPQTLWYWGFRALELLCEDSPAAVTGGRTGRGAARKAKSRVALLPDRTDWSYHGVRDSVVEVIHIACKKDDGSGVVDIPPLMSGVPQKLLPHPGSPSAGTVTQASSGAADREDKPGSTTSQGRGSGRAPTRGRGKGGKGSGTIGRGTGTAAGAGETDDAKKDARNASGRRQGLKSRSAGRSGASKGAARATGGRTSRGVCGEGGDADANLGTDSGIDKATAGGPRHGGKDPCRASLKRGRSDDPAGARLSKRPRSTLTRPPSAPGEPPVEYPSQLVVVDLTGHTVTENPLTNPSEASATPDVTILGVQSNIMRNLPTVDAHHQNLSQHIACFVSLHETYMYTPITGTNVKRRREILGILDRFDLDLSDQSLEALVDGIESMVEV